MTPGAEIYYEQLESDYENLREFRDKITKAVQACHEFIDDGDVYERYPNIVTTFEKIEALL
jgi:hypothetical protein